MNNLGILLVGGGIAIIALLLLRFYVKFASGIKAIETKLSKEGFKISHKIGRFDMMTGGTSFYLYVDDVNKKWVLTSPMDKAVDKIRRFDEYETVDFYDYDDNTWVKKMMDSEFYAQINKINHQIVRGSVGVALGGTGLMLGMAMPIKALGSVWTGAIGATVGAKAGANLGAKIAPMLDNITSPTKNVSGSYGLIIKTTDSENILVFDFLTMAAKVVVKSAPRLARNTRIYKNDMKAIAEMGKAFDHIYKSNAH